VRGVFHSQRIGREPASRKEIKRADGIAGAGLLACAGRSGSLVYDCNPRVRATVLIVSCSEVDHPAPPGVSASVYFLPKTASVVSAHSRAFFYRHILSNIGRVATRDSSRTVAGIPDLFTALCEDDSMYALFKTLNGASCSRPCLTAHRTYQAMISL